MELHPLLFSLCAIHAALIPLNWQTVLLEMDAERSCQIAPLCSRCNGSRSSPDERDAPTDSEIIVAIALG